jgi:hypothetical protein
LLRGEESPISIDAYTHGQDRNAFDRGADAATDRLVELKIVEDNIFRSAEAV